MFFYLLMLSSENNLLLKISGQAWCKICVIVGTSQNHNSFHKRKQITTDLFLQVIINYHNSKTFFITEVKFTVRLLSTQTFQVDVVL